MKHFAEIEDRQSVNIYPVMELKDWRGLQTDDVEKAELLVVIVEDGYAIMDRERFTHIYTVH